MREFKIKNGGNVILATVHSDEDVNKMSNPREIKLYCGSIIAFPVPVTVDEKQLPDDYSASFIIEIGDEVRDAIIESLTDQGVASDVAYDIAQNLDRESIEVEVFIQPNDNDVEFQNVSTY